jgi:hypothetical protein
MEGQVVNLPDDLVDAYKGVGEVWGRYWRTYGGPRAILTSPYAHAAVLGTALAFPRWWGSQWPGDVLTVLPSVLGFSLGGYAMLLAFGDAAYLKFLAGPGQRTVSFFERVSAAFVHFIVVQVAAIFFALAAQGYLDADDTLAAKAVSALGYLLFLYALATAVAATFAIFRLTSLYRVFASSQEPDGPTA